LIDQNSDKASAEAEDIQHAGIFLGCPLVIGTSGTFHTEDTYLDIIYYIYIALIKTITIMHSSNNTSFCCFLPYSILTRKADRIICVR